MSKLSIKQKQTLEAIEYFISQNGYPPTNRELASILKCAISTVFQKLMTLELKGYIKTTPSKSRSIVVMKGWEE